MYCLNQKMKQLYFLSVALKILFQRNIVLAYKLYGICNNTFNPI